MDGLAGGIDWIDPRLFEEVLFEERRIENGCVPDELCVSEVR